jgi:hypothetical protein
MVLAREFEARHCRCGALKAENAVACDACLTPGGDATEAYVRKPCSPGTRIASKAATTSLDPLQRDLHFLYQLRQLSRCRRVAGSA